MSRKKIVAGNWKMNKNLFEGKQLIADIIKGMEQYEGNHEVIIAPPFTQLELAAAQIKDQKKIALGAQNCHQEAKGAFTGEISANMLKGVTVSYVILGHSERRQYFNEGEELLSKKIDTVLAEGLFPIYCVGEMLETREANHQNEIVANQLSKALFHLNETDITKVVLAYEPVWAIGTGKTASAQQAQEMHEHIRQVLAQKYGKDIANNISILYGGSCNPENAAELFACPDVDGGLIGGAALKADDFLSIINTPNF